MGSPLTLVHEVKLCRRQLQLMALRCLVEKRHSSLESRAANTAAAHDFRSLTATIRNVRNDVFPRQDDDEFKFFIIKSFPPFDLCHDGQSQNRTFMQRISRGKDHDLLASCAARRRRRDPQTG